MAASLLSMPEFVRNATARKQTGPWTNQEKAELSRVVNLLARAGLSVEVESGMTDEGDPWFVFAHPGSGEVIAHIARIDGRFVAAGANAGLLLDGRDFREVVDKIMASQPLLFGQAAAGPAPAPQEARRRSAAGGWDGRAPDGARDGSRDASPDSSKDPRTGGDGNITTLFTHPSVVLAAFVATALMQGQNRKTVDAAAGGSGSATGSKAAFDARSNAPTARAQLNDALVSLTTPEGAAPGAAGQGGFMLHSTGLASAMAMVVAAATPVASDADGSGGTILGALVNARLGQGQTAPRDSESGGDGDAGHAVAHGASAQGGRAFDSVSAGPRGGPGAPGDGPLLHLADTGGAGHPNPDQAGSDTHDVIVDTDLFLAQLMGAIEDGTEAAPQAPAQAQAQPAHEAPAETSDSLAGTEAAAEATDGGGGSESAASGTAGSAGASGASGASGSGAGSDRLDASDESSASGPSSGPLASTETGSDGADSGGGQVGGLGTGAPGTIIQIDPLVFASGDVVEAEGADADTGTEGDKAALAGDADADGAEIGPALVIYGRGVAHALGKGSDFDASDTTEPAPDEGGQAQAVLFSGGRMVVADFDPRQDTISVTGEPATCDFYQVVPTDEGVEFRFGDSDVVSLVGLTMEDLGFA
jgi:hypothetical protein